MPAGYEHFEIDGSPWQPDRQPIAKALALEEVKQSWWEQQLRSRQAQEPLRAGQAVLQLGRGRCHKPKSQSRLKEPKKLAWQNSGTGQGLSDCQVNGAGSPLATTADQHSRRLKFEAALNRSQSRDSGFVGQKQGGATGGPQNGDAGENDSVWRPVYGMPQTAKTRWHDAAVTKPAQPLLGYKHAGRRSARGQLVFNSNSKSRERNQSKPCHAEYPHCHGRSLREPGPTSLSHALGALHRRQVQVSGRASPSERLK